MVTFKAIVEVSEVSAHALACSRLTLLGLGSDFNSCRFQEIGRNSISSFSKKFTSVVVLCYDHTSQGTCSPARHARHGRSLTNRCSFVRPLFHQRLRTTRLTSQPRSSRASGSLYLFYFTCSLQYLQLLISTLHKFTRHYMYVRRFMVSASQAINDRKRQWKDAFDQGLAPLGLESSSSPQS